MKARSLAVIIQVKYGGGLDQGGSGEKRSYSGYTNGLKDRM